MIEISPEWQEWARIKCDELMPEYADGGPLPFVRFDPDHPEVIVSAWDVTNSGDEFHDLARGVVFAELLVHRAKIWRDLDHPSLEPFVIIQEVLMAIARKGNPGPVERGFLGRIALYALAASAN